MDPKLKRQMQTVDKKANIFQTTTLLESTNTTVQVVVEQNGGEEMSGRDWIHVLLWYWDIMPPFMLFFSWRVAHRSFVNCSWSSFLHSYTHSAFWVIALLSTIETPPCLDFIKKNFFISFFRDIVLYENGNSKYVEWL